MIFNKKLGFKKIYIKIPVQIKIVPTQIHIEYYQNNEREGNLVTTHNANSYKHI